MLPDNKFQMIFKCFQKIHSKSSYLLLQEIHFKRFIFIKRTVTQKRKFLSRFFNIQKQCLENFTFLLVI